MDDLISRRGAIDTIREMSPALFSAYQHNVYVDKQEAMIRLMALPSVQTELRWITVENEPPKECRSYWVCTDTGYQCQCRWTNDIYGFGESDRWGWSIVDIPQYTKVIAYMPLPQPYERSKKYERSKNE